MSYFSREEEAGAWLTGRLTMTLRKIQIKIFELMVGSRNRKTEKCCINKVQEYCILR